MGVYEYTLRSRAACAVPDLAARRASPPGALGRSARLRSWLLVGDRGEDALVADGAARGAWSVGAARRVVAAEFGAGSSPVVLPGLLDPLLSFQRCRDPGDVHHHAISERRCHVDHRGWRRKG